MELSKTVWKTPLEYLKSKTPDCPIAFFSPPELQNSADLFLQGFPGLVSYAVKANPAEMVLRNLVVTGISTFDVASPSEMDLVRKILPSAILHYNNPVRSEAEIAHAVKCGVVSFSVDSASELEKLARQVPVASIEIAVRFKLPVSGAAYDFGEKFGASTDDAASLLVRVRELGYTPALTFHPGTQCTRPKAWETYIFAAAKIAENAGVSIARLNVGGGFPSHRMAGDKPQLEEFFKTIERATNKAFGANPPALLCEPGRGIVGDSYCLACRVKSIRDGEAVFLNDGIYGGLVEQTVVGPNERIRCFSPTGQSRLGKSKTRMVFGPTCDSIDRLPVDPALPADLAEGDYVIFQSLGAYSTSMATRFNGYGVEQVETVLALSD
jgi:ornithine decarboxylase